MSFWDVFFFIIGGLIIFKIGEWFVAFLTSPLPQEILSPEIQQKIRNKIDEYFQENKLGTIKEINLFWFGSTHCRLPTVGIAVCVYGTGTNPELNISWTGGYYICQHPGCLELRERIYAGECL